jgi:hypothetical protein
LRTGCWFLGSQLLAALLGTRLTTSTFLPCHPWLPQCVLLSVLPPLSTQGSCLPQDMQWRRGSRVLAGGRAR